MNPQQRIPTDATEEEQHIFDSAFFQKVSRLKLAITQKSTLNYQGRRRSLLKGSSAEFSDYREYLPGDDIRRIDWNVYARLEKPYVREYLEEREGAVNIFLDLSASMGFWGKDILARRLAGAMAVIALSNLDRVGLNIISGGQLQSLRFGGNKGNVKRALLAVEKATAGGMADLEQAVRGVSYLPRGMTILISDFCEESFLQKGEKLCRYLRYKGQEVILLQISAPEERSVAMSGTYSLEDSEGAYDIVNLSLDNRTAEAYERAYSGFLEETHRIAAAAGAGYYTCRVEDGYEKILTQSEKFPIFKQ